MLEHLKAVVQLATVLGPESHLLQPHVSKLLQVILKAQDLTVEHSFRAAEVLDTAVLLEHVKSRLRTALEERLRLPKRGGKVPRQDWCALPLYLPPPLMRTLTGEDGMFVKLDLLMQWLLSVGLRGPYRADLGCYHCPREPVAEAGIAPSPNRTRPVFCAARREPGYQ